MNINKVAIKEIKDFKQSQCNSKSPTKVTELHTAMSMWMQKWLLLY